MEPLSSQVDWKNSLSVGTALLAIFSAVIFLLQYYGRKKIDRWHISKLERAKKLEDCLHQLEQKYIDAKPGSIISLKSIDNIAKSSLWEDLETAHSLLLNGTVLTWYFQELKDEYNQPGKYEESLLFKEYEEKIILPIAATWEYVQLLRECRIYTGSKAAEWLSFAVSRWLFCYPPSKISIWNKMQIGVLALFRKEPNEIHREVTVDKIRVLMSYWHKYFRDVILREVQRLNS